MRHPLLGTVSPTLGAELNIMDLAITKDTRAPAKTVLDEITAHTYLKSQLFFNYIKEEDSYCNFLKLHLVKSHRKVWKR